MKDIHLLSNVRITDRTGNMIYFSIKKKKVDFSPEGRFISFPDDEGGLITMFIDSSERVEIIPYKDYLANEIVKTLCYVNRTNEEIKRLPCDSLESAEFENGIIAAIDRLSAMMNEYDEIDLRLRTLLCDNAEDIAFLERVKEECL